MMGTAFLGYTLPWGMMSYWGATVITNLLSAIPWIGSDIVEFSYSFTLSFLPTIGSINERGIRGKKLVLRRVKNILLIFLMLFYLCL